jgi:sugar phosphate isomerase/epimerase
MSRVPVGIQMASLRELCKRDLMGTLEEVAGMGYEGVEFAGLYGYDPSEVRDRVRDLGMAVIGNHLCREGNPDRLLEMCRELGCPTVWGECLPGGAMPRDRAGCLEMVRLANQLGAILKKGGVQFYYHNHAEEFQRVDGRYIMDWLLEMTDPGCVVGEVDVMWTQYAGVDPASYIRRHAGRVPYVHIKDMDAERDFTEVGRGVIDFDSIFEACEGSVLRWYVVEQDTFKGDPIEGVAESLEYFRARGML